ncbi:hypothetical protein BCR34DRAFT_606324 [Clohesyomyces aquaticus]|uniref:ATP-dependent DNA helicase n=1 Tax=Clohesyomyces aquaticus TaxID=1231657 RepID=A0A1Y1YQC3_9PLEO|nr:hypothetical protein BCR34DRAFT_606324 [Clohesyomyces aquaticus]
MEDSDEYGDSDDSAFLEAATQLEKAPTPTFLPSPRPTKRRRVDQQDERGPVSIPPSRRPQLSRPGPFIDSDSEFEGDFDQFATTRITRKAPPAHRVRNPQNGLPLNTATTCQIPERQNERAVASSDDSDGPRDPGPAATRFTPRRRNYSVQSSEELDAGALSTGATSLSSNGKKSRKKRSCARQKETGEDGDEEESAKKRYGRTKNDRIHTPAVTVDLTDIAFTAMETAGAIWQKPPLAIGVHRPGEAETGKWTGHGAMKTMALAGRQSISSRLVSRQSASRFDPIEPIVVDASPKLPVASGPAEDYDPAEELAYLPSDAFASSSSSPQKEDDDVVLVSEKRTRLVAPQTGLRQTTLFGGNAVVAEIPPSQVNKRFNFVATQREEPPTHHKIDREAMKTWVYPTNLGEPRDYQFNIVARGLFHNLLVALPTGLGKTFIAATIMLNWYRWTTDAQIVFVAPTKPLCTQQVQACFGITGIPRHDTTLLTGGVQPSLRAEEWVKKRVFFMTPQTLLNDLKSGYADPKRIVLLVVDEAHRATGSYAYVEVVSLMRRFNSSFRILALTATPGSDVEAVQKVIDGLDISRVEIRTEISQDIARYIYSRKVEKHVFKNSEEMEMCMNLYADALRPIVAKVASLNAFWSKDPLDCTPYGCNQARSRWIGSAGRNVAMPVKAMVNTIFGILGTISQAMELLKYHGIGPFYTKLRNFKEENAGKKSKYMQEIIGSEPFKKLIVRLEAWVLDDNFVGHPKLEFLQEAILDHFVNAAEGRNPDGAPPSQTRIMVFAHFRDSAEEIVKILKRHQPMIRPHVFVGQASAKNSEGMGQKEQLGVVEKFKSGTYNTLVATSIGEEGLDIGEVDLIICYDSKASPIRMLQRMGRTGRKRQGKIILLQMEGKEVNDAQKARDSYEYMQGLIADGRRFNFHDEVSRRIVPPEVQPVVDQRVVEIPLENSQADFLPEPRKNGRAPKRPPKKFHMPDGVITGFVAAGRMDQEIAPKPRAKKKLAPVYPSEEPFAWPPLETVLLNEEESKACYNRYQRLEIEEDSDSDDEEEVNDAPAFYKPGLHKWPERQRVPSKSGIFKRPGRAAQLLVGTLQRMHDMTDERLDEFRKHIQEFDIHAELERNAVVLDNPDHHQVAVMDPDMWADDDPPSLPQPKGKAKTTPKPKAKAAQKMPAPRGCPPRVDSITTPMRAPNPKPATKTPNYRMSGLADEGEESSPPPTDPGMRLGSQAVSLGSDDTVVDDVEDTQAYLQDSDLRSFIAADEEEVDIPNSSLPSLDFGGLGKGTQAVVRSAMKPRREARREKIFTSDPTDDDAVVSSDGDSDVRVGNATVVDSASEEEDALPVVSRKRARRVVLEDDDDDE